MAAEKKMGKVFLVGAGPGDPGLLTLRGAEVLAEAEVVLYDRLANEDLLLSAPASAELIPVGKAASHHTLPQEEINALLAQKALEGKTVCRLKGGDPFVFGRGGEEASHLRALGIPFEVIPGVTSSVAVPAYAGIPVTDRRHARSFAVVTGHTRNFDLDIDWKGLGADTLVFLMGHTNLERICEELQRHGRPAHTPVAVIERGTTRHQRTATGTLANIAAEVRDRKIGTPALIVVGHVVSLREELDWFESRPLAGRRVLVTRPRPQARELAAALREQGADVVLHPLIETRALPLSAPCVAELSNADWVLFASANGVEHLVEGLLALGKDVRALGNARLAAIGKTSAEALTRLGLRVEFIPTSFVGEDFATQLPDVEGRRIVVVRSAQGREALVEGLTARGAQVTSLFAYETIPTRARLPSLESIDVVTFTSPSTVEALVSNASQDTLTSIRGGLPKAAAIGPVTAEALRRAGIPVACEAPTASATSLARALSALLGDTP